MGVWLGGLHFGTDSGHSACKKPHLGRSCVSVRKLLHIQAAAVEAGPIHLGPARKGTGHPREYAAPGWGPPT